jgi:hypothetical protein
MSATLLKAHGGSKNLLGTSGQIINPSIFIQDTMVGKQKSASSAHLDSLVANTIGEPGGRPVMDGVLTNTKQGVKMSTVPEIHKVSDTGKTQPKRMGQVPFAGKRY